MSKGRLLDVDSRRRDLTRNVIYVRQQMTDKNLISIHAVIDESGSMGPVVNDTINGFNTFLNEQKRQPGKALMSLTKFNGSAVSIYSHVPIERAEPLTYLNYRPGGGTALLDAFGGAIDAAGNHFARLPERERPGKVLFLVITDGEENASRFHTHTSVRSKVQHQRERYAWEFVFMGANIDAFSVAQSYGICTSNALQFTSDSAGIGALYANVSASTNAYRAGGQQVVQNFFNVPVPKK